MLDLPARYYPCFLGNGTDAVLVGPTGSMVGQRLNGPDRCYWYKADRYYSDERPALPVLHRHYRKEVVKVPRAVGSWYELAPLGRTWYEVRLDGRALNLASFSQAFQPDEAVLRTRLDYGPVAGEATTFLHARLPVLAERHVFDQEVEFRACCWPGPWEPDELEPDPYGELELHAGEVARVSYRLGSVLGVQALLLGESPDEHALGEGQLVVSRRAREVTKFYLVVDGRDLVSFEHTLAEVQRHGFDGLLASHRAIWQEHSRQSSVELPDREVQRFYNFSQYYFKAIQNPLSGGLPVGNLRQTWSSHVFWDSFFIARALLGAGHVAEVRDHCEFFRRTLDHAREHARRDFGAPGLKWDWELTHRGEPAYGEDWVHVKEQVHNNAAYSNTFWDYYCFTRDRAGLQALYPLIRGIAEFFRAAVMTRTESGYGTRPLVGVRESQVRVPNDGLNLAGAIRVLTNAAQAARALGVDAPFARECEQAATELRPAVDRLYNGRYFRSHEESEELSLASLAPVYPMAVVAPDDPRVILTARALLTDPAGDVFTRSGYVHNPWLAGALATVCTGFGDVETAWQLVLACHRAWNVHGGSAEFVDEAGCWNLQYFGTAHGAVCTAIQTILVWPGEAELAICPFLPGDWPACHFAGLRASGLEIAADWDRGDRLARVRLHNPTASRISTSVVAFGERFRVDLATGSTLDRLVRLGR